MLAPVLARLRRVPGIADARVECSGVFFLLTIDDRADVDAALRSALDVLGSGARRLPGDGASEQLEARRRGEIWFSEQEIRGLSYVEARVITGRALAAATAGLDLEEAHSERTREAIRAEVFAAIDRVHDEGGRSSSGWFGEEWPHVVARVRGRLDGAVPEPALREIAARLLSLH